MGWNMKCRCRREAEDADRSATQEGGHVVADSHGGRGTMRKALLLLILLLCSSSAYAQLTTVTATISDSAGTAYSFGSYIVSLVNTTNQQPLFGGNANFQQVYSGGLDTNGLLSISLPSVTVMTPSPGLQWKFFICANPLH